MMPNLPARVLFLTSTFPDKSDGVRGVFIKELAVELLHRGIEVDVLTPRIFDFSPEAEAMSGVRVFRFPFRSDQKLLVEYSSPPVKVMLSYILSGVRAAGKLHRERGYDLIHGHWVIPTGMMAAWLARRIRRPLVVSAHGSDLLVWSRKKLLNQLTRWTLRQAQVCSANSQSMLELTRCLGGRVGANSLIFETGVDLKTFAPPDDLVAAKQAAGFEPSETILLLVGHLIDRKGPDVAVSAFARLLRDNRNLRLVLAGDGTARAKVERQVAELNLESRVSLLGAVDHDRLPLLYRACDIFLLPSRSEGMGVVLLEAAASGKPAVATLVGGIPSVVVEGATGFLVPPDDVEALAQSLVRLLDDSRLREKMGAAARQLAEKEFGREEQVRRIVELYCEAMATAQKSKTMGGTS